MAATSRRVWCAAMGGWLGLIMLGCGSEPKVPRKPPQPGPEPLSVRPIESLVVGAGLVWLVHSRPQHLLRHPVLSPKLSRFIPPVRRRVFDRLTGIDIDAADEVVVAGYGDSTLFVIDGVADVFETERRFRDRLLRDVIHKTYRPDAIWTHGQTAAGRTRALSALSPGVVAIEGGGTLRSKVALLYATGRLRKAPRALALPDMQQVFDELGDAPVRAIAPGPFSGEWGEAMDGMLAVCTAVGASVRVDEQGQFDLSTRFAGAWGDDAQRATDHLMSGWDEVATSSLGRLLNLDEPIRGPDVDSHGDLVGLNVRIDGVKLLDGLFDVVAADVQELMDLGGSAGS